MSASSPRPATNETDESPLDGRPIHYIIQNLERAYGVPENRNVSDPLDMLIGIILSISAELRHAVGAVRGSG